MTLPAFNLPTPQTTPKHKPILLPVRQTLLKNSRRYFISVVLLSGVAAVFLTQLLLNLALTQGAYDLKNLNLENNTLIYRMPMKISGH